MNRSAKLVSSLLARPAQRSTPSLTLVRNAGGPAAAHGPGLPFPPGPRQFEQLKNWTGSLGIFGATAFGLLCYLSDWKVVVTYIPFYNGKFKEEEPPK